MLTEKQRLGIILEKWLYSILKSLFKKKDGYKIIHVDWKHYSWGHGLDLRVFYRHKQILAIECKNWRILFKPYGTSVTIDQILARFRNYAGGLKLLVITTLSLLTKEARQILQRENIHVIETQKLIGRKDFPRKGYFAELFYSIKNQIRQLLQSPKKVLWGKQCTFDNVVVDTCHTTTKQGHDTAYRIQYIEQVITHQFDHVGAVIEAYFEYGKG